MGFNSAFKGLIMKFDVTDLNKRRRRNAENARCMESNLLTTASFLQKRLLGHKKRVKNRLVKEGNSITAVSHLVLRKQNDDTRTIKRFVITKM